MQPYSAPPGDAWQLGKGPFIFRGVPPRCVGDVELINNSDEKVTVRAIAAAGSTDKTVSDPGLTQLKVGVRLHPRECTRARAFFHVDLRTPPGTYNVDLSCGDQREPVVVHVWEKTRLTIEPRVIPLRGAGGDVLKAVAVISNEGNVTETFRELALVYLEEHEWLGRAQVYAMRQTKEGEGIQVYLDHLIDELRSTMPREARVAIRTEISELRPGETRELEVEMTLPEGLKKGRTYFGFAKFMSGELKFKVECNGANNSTKRRSQ